MPPEWDRGAGSALLVVDLQNDFADRRGTLYVRGGESVADSAAELARAAAEAGSLVVCTQDWHPEATPHFREYGGLWPRHCVAGSWGAELHPSMPAGHPVVRKGEGAGDGYSGFGVRELGSGVVSPTGLHQLLARSGIAEVVLAGLALDVCIRATALDALALGYRVTLRRGATAAVDLTPGDGERALQELELAGVAVE